MTAILLVHSPFVGPGSLEPLAEVLRAKGHEAFCPDVRNAQVWSEFAAKAVAASNDAGFVPTLVVGHSGAGAAIPAIGAALGAQGLIFLDAILPPENGTWAPVEPFRTRLVNMADADGMLPPWNTWWNPNMMRRLVPDEALRGRIEGECVPVQLDLYLSGSVQPEGWSSPKSCVYIRLSNAYTDETNEAEARGWSVTRLDGSHLDAATRPVETANLIEASMSTTRVPVGDLVSLRKRGGVTVPRNAPKVLIVAPHDAGPFAVINECVHQGAELLAGYVSATAGSPWIECPLHMWRYSLTSGVRLIRDEPSTDPLDRITTYPCVVDRSGMIWIEVPTPSSPTTTGW